MPSKPVALPTPPHYFSDKHNLLDFLVHAFSYVRIFSPAVYYVGPKEVGFGTKEAGSKVLVSLYNNDWAYYNSDLQDALMNNLQAVAQDPDREIEEASVEGLTTFKVFLKEWNSTFFGVLQPYGKLLRWRFYIAGGHYKAAELPGFMDTTHEVIVWEENLTKFPALVSRFIKKFEANKRIEPSWCPDNAAYVVTIKKTSAFVRFHDTSKEVNDTPHGQGPYLFGKTLPSVFNGPFSAASEKGLDAQYTDVLEKANETQDDPFLDIDKEETEPPEYRNGSEEEFKQVFEWMTQALTDVNSSEVRAECVTSSPDESGSIEQLEGLDTSKPKVSFPVFEETLNQVYDYFAPYGVMLVYNDDAHNRRSGYSEERQVFVIQASSASSFHVQLAAQARLLEWLLEKNILTLSSDKIKELLCLDI